MYDFTTDKIELDLIDACPEIPTEGLAPWSAYRQVVTLKWSVEFEFRSWGLKGTTVIVPDQTIEFEIERETDESSDAETITVELKNVAVEFTDAKFEDSLLPSKLEFYKGKWTLYF